MHVCPLPVATTTNEREVYNAVPQFWHDSHLCMSVLSVHECAYSHLDGEGLDDFLRFLQIKHHQRGHLFGKATASVAAMQSFVGVCICLRWASVRLKVAKNSFKRFLVNTA